MDNKIYTTNYIQLVMDNNSKLEKIYLESVLEAYQAEMDFMTDCLEAGMVTMEALQKTEVEVTKKRGIIDRIMDALKALFGKFKEKITILTDRDNEWLKQNLAKITPDTMRKLPEFEAYPLWTRAPHAMFDDLRTISIDLVNRTKNSQPELEDLEKIVRQKIGGKKSLSEDAINFFRTGKSNGELKTVKCDGNQLMKYANDMIEYVVDYDKIVVPAIQKFINQTEKLVKTIVPKDNITESFCLLENTMYTNTIIGMLPNVYGSYVMEETEDSQLKNGKIVDRARKETEKPSMTSIKITDKGKEQQAQMKNEEKEDVKTYDSTYIKDVTNILKILEGAVLTVLEERYLLFISIFKKIVEIDEAKGSSGKKSKDSSVEKEKATDEERQERVNSRKEQKNKKKEERKEVIKNKKK